MNIALGAIRDVGSITRPRAKRPSLSGTAQNWPALRCRLDFGVNGYSTSSTVLEAYDRAAIGARQMR